MHRLFFLMIFCWGMQLKAASLQLINDTPYDLQAQIYTADGTLLGTETIKTEESASWNSSFAGYTAPMNSQTPYTVAWSCTGNAEEGFYSRSDPVGTGSTVIASQGNGAKTCTMKKKKKSSENNPPSTGQQMRRGAGPPQGLLK